VFLAAKTAEISNEGEYLGRCMVHLDAFCWVKRDSYLPQGQQGLKAVTRNKLGYDPAEVDPEDMLRFARERPHHMASYSVSDAVATFYLYTTYVHNFIFSLSTIIPMGPEDVLRKGSGTLCEALLMVEAFKGQIVCPNKQVDKLESFYEGHLLESETYIGGHVECLEAGIFRSDILNKFSLVPSALQMLIDHVDRDLTFALEVENGIQRSEIENYDDIKQEIVNSLEMLRDSPIREEYPMILHLDVGAMYPNIILTNRLQPSAIVSQKDCAACDFNRLENNCKRNMAWKWRGDYSPANLGDYNAVKRQLAYEKFESTDPFSEKKIKLFSELSDKEQAKEISKRLKMYSQGHYRKSKITKTEERVDTVCMRENGFYVDTVRAFRDRRYDYKLLTKQWKGKLSAAEKAGDALAKREAESKIALMDSLQIAHKCILNSFYGYVMRKGARWRSMEMAGIVTHNGADLIKQARILVEQIGRPLELDTDGIWCILPSSFPQNYKFKKKVGGGTIKLEYPCAMLNADVHNRNTNHQYQDLVAGHDGTKGHGLPKYATHSECSIYFELDGPYKAMILPASPEEGKLLKKKYVVFNHDDSIAELKGFELKRRGELELVKAFQQQVFSQFLEGHTLETAFAAVGRVANLWLDVLDSKGVDMDDDELLELISERKTISKTLEDYEGRKATSLTTAARLADFLGSEMVKDKGLNCNLIISRLPAGAPVTERAIPVTIFSAEPHVKVHYLRKWLKNHSLECADFREVVDWDYYKDRLGRLL
jgi:DNA polymerase epsilon subunit 1